MTHKLITIFCLTTILLTACARKKTFIIEGKEVVVHPYGWANKDVNHHDSIAYKANVPNVIFSILGVATIGVPVWLSGWQWFEPVSKKSELFK